MDDSGSDLTDGVRVLYSDGGYLSRHPNWHAERSPWKAAHVLRGLRAVGVTPQTLCDIGCGTGLALAEVARQLPGVERAVGFEPSEDAPLHPDAAARIELRREDATTSEERFDLALMLDVFEHVEDYFAFLRACQSLAPVFAFHIPLDAFVTNLLRGGFMGSRENLGHLHYFTRRTALATLSEAGFSVRHWHFTQSGWDRPARNPWRPVSLVRRAIHAISPEATSLLVGGLALLVIAEVREG